MSLGLSLLSLFVGYGVASILATKIRYTPQLAQIDGIPRTAIFLSLVVQLLWAVVGLSGLAAFLITHTNGLPPTDVILLVVGALLFLLQNRVVASHSKTTGNAQPRA